MIVLGRLGSGLTLLPGFWRPGKASNSGEGGRRGHIPAPSSPGASCVSKSSAQVHHVGSLNSRTLEGPGI